MANAGACMVLRENDALKFCCTSCVKPGAFDAAVDKNKDKQARQSRHCNASRAWWAQCHNNIIASCPGGDQAFASPATAAFCIQGCKPGEEDLSGTGASCIPCRKGWCASAHRAHRGVPVPVRTTHRAAGSGQARR